MGESETFSSYKTKPRPWKEESSFLLLGFRKPLDWFSLPKTLGRQLPLADLADELEYAPV